MQNILSRQWLEILCSIIPDVQAAMFMMLDKEEKTIKPVAKWPANLDQFADFTSVVKYAFKKNSHVCIPHVPVQNKQAFDFFAYPVYIESELLGVIAVKVNHQPKENHKVIFKVLQQGSTWLQIAHLQQAPQDNFYQNIVGLLAGCYEHESYQQSLIELVKELTKKLDCDRVAFAERKHQQCKVTALSNSADYDPRSNLLQIIAEAMDEAIEQDSAIIYPTQKSVLVQVAHQKLADKFNKACVCTVPLVNHQKIVGCISLIRDSERPFKQENIHLCEQTMNLVTPFLVLKQNEEQSIWVKIGQALHRQFADLVGFRHLKLKLISFSVFLVLLLSSMINVEYRITSDAVLEGKIQRVISAPIAGYLNASHVQAGDTVIKNETMASLDDSELKLELSKLNSQLQQTRREYREAQSIQDLVQTSITSAKISQIVAEKELIQQKMSKINLSAPFDGVVIEGDLSQKLGAPVERGETLFKIAPLEGYRVIVKVNEQQIAYIKPGQEGSLTLSSLPNFIFPLRVEKITSIANVDDGANVFRVEADISNAPDFLRPGMEGIAKVKAGKASQLWVWTHEMLEWMRLWFWSW